MYCNVLQFVHWTVDLFLNHLFLGGKKKTSWCLLISVHMSQKSHKVLRWACRTYSPPLYKQHNKERERITCIHLYKSGLSTNISIFVESLSIFQHMRYQHTAEGQVLYLRGKKKKKLDEKIIFITRSDLWHFSAISCLNGERQTRQVFPSVRLSNLITRLSMPYESPFMGKTLNISAKFISRHANLFSGPEKQTVKHKLETNQTFRMIKR